VFRLGRVGRRDQVRHHQARRRRQGQPDRRGPQGRRRHRRRGARRGPWEIHLWAKLDNAAEGPLYFQFYQNLNGTSSDVWRYDEENFPGGKYFSADIELLGGKGFNKDRTYDVKAVQVSAKGKDITLATGKIKLIKSGKKPEKDPNEEEEVDPDQDAHDSLAGDEPAATRSLPRGPPPSSPRPRRAAPSTATAPPGTAPCCSSPSASVLPPAAAANDDRVRSEPRAFPTRLRPGFLFGPTIP
jgi:hypothetical protein